MVAAPDPQQSASLPLIECGLTAIAIASAFLCPRLASTLFDRVERILGAVARRRRVAVLIPGLALLVLRLGMLPLAPIPLPFVPDDFSFLLAANTFAMGRLTNPTPAMWAHFESMHIDMHPTYMSMYFPAQGLLLAAGKVFLGHPWFGVLISGALMCSAICWMLQAWLPPAWAFLGGMLAVLRIGLFTYWINTYHSGGAIAALGGALVLGALPRYTRSMRNRDAILMSVGMVLLMLTRPYEGMLLCVPVMVVLIRWFLQKKGWVARRILLRSAALPLLLIVAAGSWLAYYDYRAFGSPTTLPYTINRATYARAPYYVWEPERPAPVYRHAVLQDFYENKEMEEFVKLHEPHGFVSMAFIKALRAFLFFAGITLLMPMIMVHRAIMDRRIRFLAICALVLVPGMLIEIYLIPHYLAPFTVVFYAIGLQSLRHVRVWRPEGRPVGVALARACVVLCVGMAALRMCTKPLHIVIDPWPASNWSGMWYGPEHFGAPRAQMEERLAGMRGKHLVIVRYTERHYPFDEWVYNSPDIDNSKIVWAREMDQESNKELISYYNDRHIWLVQPDVNGGQLSPYPWLGKMSESAELASAQEATPGK